MAVVAVSHPPLFRFDQSRGHGAARDIDLPGQRNLSAYFLEMGPLVTAQAFDDSGKKFLAGAFRRQSRKGSL